MNVLIACEFSGVVREAFRKRGHNAYSCDLLPAEDGSAFHYECDVHDVLGNKAKHPKWDLLIAHPPCTYLCNSGVRWLYGGKGKVKDAARWAEMEKAAHFFADLLRGHKIPRVAVENPVMHGHARELIDLGPADQIVQPWQFGHGEIKATCLWLRNLPLLVPTDIVEGRKGRVHFESPGPDRWKRRSITYTGIAEAMAEQWGSLP